MFLGESLDLGLGFGAVISAVDTLGRLAQRKRLRKVTYMKIPDMEHVLFASRMGRISPHM